MNKSGYSTILCRGLQVRVQLILTAYT